MNIVVCVKQVPDTTDIKIDPVTQSADSHLIIVRVESAPGQVPDVCIESAGASCTASARVIDEEFAFGIYFTRARLHTIIHLGTILQDEPTSLSITPKSG